MTGDCGDVVTSLGAWAAWTAGPAAVQARVDAMCVIVWAVLGLAGPAPRIDLEDIL